MIRLPASAAALALIWVFPVLVRSAETSGGAASGVFSCRGRPAGYYADLQSGCQRYHMCDAGGRRYSYACPNQTLFQQRVMICDHWFMVDCALSESFFGANELLGQPGKQFVADNDQFFQRTQEESTLRRRPGGRRPVDRTSAAYLASVAYRPSTASFGVGAPASEKVGTPVPGRVEPRTLPAAYANNPFFRGLTADAATASTSAATAPTSTFGATFRPNSTPATFRPNPTPGATFRPNPTPATFRTNPTPGATFRQSSTPATFRNNPTPATFRTNPTPGATFRQSSTPPPPTTTTPRDRDPATQNVHELRNQFGNREEEAVATSTPIAARPTPTSDQIVVTRQGQAHHFAEDASELRDELSPVGAAPSSIIDAGVNANVFRGNEHFRVPSALGFDALGADPLTGADPFKGANPFSDTDNFNGVELELTNTLELRLPDTRRMFFIADNPLREAEMLRANNETVLTIALSQPSSHHGAMRFKGARSPKGQRSGCPQCHPAFLLPGTCEPCVLIR